MYIGGNYFCDKITKIYLNTMLNFKLFFRYHGKIMSEFYTELNALSAHTNFIFADGLVATAERHNGASCHFPAIFHFECRF